MIDELLPNGLRLVVEEDHVAPVVAVNVAYGAGTSREGQGEGELAHLFEHLMFEGSRHVAPGEHVALLSEHGGMANGRTEPDCATYASVVPSHCAELVLWLEAERLAHLRDGMSRASLDRQREVVRNEHLQRRLGVPYGSAPSDLAERLFPPGHLYHTSMARRAELDAASEEAVAAFYERHYVPGNAVVAVCGDVDEERVRDWAASYFGEVPRRPVPPPRTATHPPCDEVRETIRARVPAPRAYVGWRGPAEDTPEYGALLVAVTVLAGGRRARLRDLDATLVPDGRAQGSFLHGWVSGDDVALAEKSYLAAVDALADEGPTGEEVARAVRLLTTARLTARAQIGGRAYGIARGALLYDDPRHAPAFDDVTPERVRAVAGEVLASPHRVVLTYLPEDAP